ncbi:hypothetical protein ES703_01587 [subsurface metagenome]
MVDIEITPRFDQETRIINPAIDIIEDKAAIGIWLPCDVVSTTKSGAHEVKSDFRPFFIMEDRTYRPTFDLPPGYALESKPIQTPQRWRTEDIKKFLDGAEAPNPAEVFHLILGAWDEFVELPNLAETIYQTLWGIGTYFAQLFQTYPYNYVGGVKQTGKTKSLTLHAALCFNTVLSGNISTAALYRIVQNSRGTLLLDESEKLAGRYTIEEERARDLKNVLLSGYKKGTLVYRAEKGGGKGEKIIVVPFHTYGPKAIDNIKGIGDILADRCKITIMRRTRGEQGKREIDLNNPRWAEVRDKLYRFYLAYWREIKEIYDNLGERCELVNMVSNRDRELWGPIFALAKFFDSKLVNVDNEHCERSEHNECKVMSVSKTTFTSALRSLKKGTLSEVVLDLAKENAEIKRTEEMTETGELILMQVLLAVVDKDAYFKVKNIRDAMASHFDEPQEWLTTRWAGGALKRLGFAEKRRVGTGYEYRLTPQDVKDVADRLGVGPPEEPPKGLQQKLEVKPEEIEEEKPTEPTAQDIERAVCEYRKTTLAKVKLAELIGVPLDRLKTVLEELEKKGAVRDMGAMVEVC